MSSILKKASAWWFCSYPRKDQSSWVLCRLLCTAILQTMCQWGTDKQRNKEEDTVSMNEATFKGSSEAFLKCFTERRCFSNHKKSSLTKSGKTVKTTLKQRYTRGLLNLLHLVQTSFLFPYSVYKILSWAYKGLMKAHLTLWTQPFRHLRPSTTQNYYLCSRSYCT